MTQEEARNLLRIHCLGDEDLIQVISPHSFLGSLRPFVGLREENYHEIMSALRVLASTLQGDIVDREIMSYLWNICWQSSLIGLHSTGALQRNNLLTEQETDKLESWVFQICFTVSLLLEGQEVDVAFAEYDNGYGSAPLRVPGD